jgi:hypothetical protein
LLEGLELEARLNEDLTAPVLRNYAVIANSWLEEWAAT